MKWALPQFPFGGVYYRKANPPADDWERDYYNMSRNGFNTVRHWFMWSAIQVAPDRWHWDDYDRQLDLAAKYGMKTIIAEITHAAPEWAFFAYPHARICDANGHPVRSQIRNSTVTGGFPGLCLDNDDVRALAEAWLAELAARYKGHPGLGGYDVWNELNLHSSGGAGCHCAATKAQFRAWLQAKYGDIRDLAEAWRRHSYTDWEQVEPSPTKGPYVDYLDYVEFRIQNAYRLLQWRIDTIRKVDPDVPIVGHGVGHATLHRRLEAADDAWMAGKVLDGYGYSGGGADGRNGWSRVMYADLARAGANGKPYWACELAADHGSWSTRGGTRKSRFPDAAALRRAHFMAMAGGVTGIFSHRVRPQTDGPYFGMHAYYNMDGSANERSDMAGRIARWANAPEQAKLWQARPVQGDIGIVVIPEAQVLLALQFPEPACYCSVLVGSYNAFVDAGIQADWVSLEQIDRYDLLYLPFAFALSQASADKLMAWVEAGGRLIADGCTGYFDDRGRAGTVQPNLGLDRLFGAREAYMEIAPDLLEVEKAKFTAQFATGTVRASCGYLRQAYAEAGGQAAGWFDECRVAVIDNTYGKGRTRLIGTILGWAYAREPSAEQRALFAGFLSWAGKRQHVRHNGTNLLARLHHGEGGTYLWLVNDDPDAAANVTAELSDAWGPFSSAENVWGEQPVTVRAGRVIETTVPPHDAAVIRLG